jgi:hypothetical protein
MSDPKEDETLPGTPTVSIPKADPALILLTQIKLSMDAGFTEVRSDLESVKNEGQRTNLRLTRQEVRMDDVEVRLGHNSLRAKAESSHDLEQDAQLVQERAAREALAAKVDTLLAIGERLDKLAKNPIAKVVGTILAFTLAGYAASHGITIKP